MSQETLEERIALLEHRLSLIEAQLGIAPAVVHPSDPPIVRSPVASLTQRLRDLRAAAAARTSPSPAAAAPELVENLTVYATVVPIDAPSDSTVAEAPPGSHLPPPLPHFAPPLRPELPLAIPYEPTPVLPLAPQTGLEQAIGLKWAGWIGAIVLVTGAALGIKFAYDQGWFNAISDSFKVVLMWLTGFALIGVGEWIYRRVNKLSAAGFFGAGVAMLFVVSYAGHGFYQLYARDTAFVLMGLSTLIGAAVAIRGNLVSIAVLSLLGGNLAPVVLSENVPNLHAFFAYLLMLQVVALVLASWGRQPKWWTLRGLSLATNTFWIFGLIASHSHGADIPAELIFVTLAAILYQAELLASTWRAGERPSPFASIGFGLQIDANPGVVFSTLVTAALTAAILLILHDASHTTRGTWVLAISAICTALGFILPHRDKPAMRALFIGYRIQATALLIVAVPVIFSGPNARIAGQSIEMGWLMLALAFAIMSAMLDLPISRFAAVITWGLAVVHLHWRVVDASDEFARTIAFTLRGTEVPTCAIIGWIIALVGQPIAALIGRTKNPNTFNTRLTWCLSVAASAVWVIASLAALPPIGATLMLVLYAWIMVGVDMLTDRLWAALQAAVIVGLATAKWVFVDLLASRFATSWSPMAQPVIFNVAMGTGVLISLSLPALYWLRRERLLTILRRWGMGESAERDAVLSLAALVIGLLTIGLSFEIDRVAARALFLNSTSIWPPAQTRQLLLTMLWTAAATLHLALVRYVEPDPIRRHAWAVHIGWLPIFCAVKYQILDTLIPRFNHSITAVAVLFNLQTITALVLIGGLLMVRAVDPETVASNLRKFAAYLIVLILLWTGCLEIDRAFEKLAANGSMPYANAHLAKSVALSVYGAVFAILSVIAGFRLRSAPARYFGLGLFALTLLKVVVVDLADAGQGYRVLSFIGLGLLLLGTSVVYGKLSPKLLGESPT